MTKLLPWPSELSSSSPTTLQRGTLWLWRTHWRVVPTKHDRRCEMRYGWHHRCGYLEWRTGPGHIVERIWHASRKLFVSPGCRNDRASVGRH